MKHEFRRFLSRSASSYLMVLAVTVPSVLAGKTPQDATGARNPSSKWREKAVEYARIMSRVKWTPVADGMPHRRGGHFEKGTEYTGVPYSSVRWKGRYIGFDIFLKTFLAAVENPESVIYTENLAGKVPNAATYYGKVCSSLTSYALQCGIWYVSQHHITPYRDGIVLVAPQSAQAAEIGDIIQTTSRAHVEIVTEVVRNGDGTVTHVLVEDSWPPTTRTIKRSAADFESYISSRGNGLYRIVDLDAWRGSNRADAFLFPNYEEDSAETVINRALLLDYGDWVPYLQGQAVKMNVMDRDGQGVKSLVVKRGGVVVEELALSGKGVIERSFDVCGDYTAHCVMADGSASQACEFSVSNLDLAIPDEPIVPGKPWKIQFSSCNMNIIIVYIWSLNNPLGRYSVWVGDQDRRRGSVTVPADLLKPEDAGGLQVWLIGENRYGRLKKIAETTLSTP